MFSCFVAQFCKEFQELNNMLVLHQCKIPKGFGLYQILKMVFAWGSACVCQTQPSLVFPDLIPETRKFALTKDFPDFSALPPN